MPAASSAKSKQSVGNHSSDIYLSNEHPFLVDVYFDDVTVSFTPSMVVQVEDYYPFGLAYNTSRRENSVAQNYDYNGKEEQDELLMNWADFGARMLDRSIGRWTSIDALSENMRRHSPYNYGFNNPCRYDDLDGMGPGDRVKFAKDYLRTAYKKQDETKLRTEYTTEALEFMDCSELVSRVLSEDGLTAGVKHSNTGGLITDFTAEGSNWQEVTEPSEGDIILWSGHTAIVEGYDSESKKVSVIHATSYKDKNGNTVSGVLAEKYSLSYYEGKKAKFYRPIKDTSDDGKKIRPATTKHPISAQKAEALKEKPSGPTWSEIGLMLQNWLSINSSIQVVFR